MAAVLTCLCMLVLLCVLPRKYLWFARIRSKLLIALALAAFVLNYIGFSAKYADAPLTAAAMTLYGTAKTLTLSNVSTDYLAYIPQLTWFPAAYGVLLCLTTLVVAAVALSLWGYRVMCALRLGFLRVWGTSREILLFSALNEKAFSVASSAVCDRKAKKPLALFFVDAKPAADAAAALENQCAQQGFILVSRKQRFTRGFDRIVRRRSGQCLRVFAIQDTDDANLAFLVEAAAALAGRKRTPANISSYVLLQNGAYRRVFDSDAFTALDVHPLFADDLACRELFARFIPISAARNGVLHAAILGTGPIIARLLRYLCILGQTPDTRLVLTVIGKDAEREIAQFRRQCPMLPERLCLEGLSLAYGTEDYDLYFEEHITDIDCFFVADADAAAISLYDRLQDRRIVRPLWLYAAEMPAAFDGLLESGAFDRLCCFGKTKALYTTQVLVDERLDRLAKAVHAYYCREFGMDTPWDALSAHAKDSNRSSALHIHTKLYSLGLRAAEGGDTTMLKEKLKDPAVVSRLAQMEHLRWNAYHFVNGWRLLPLAEANGTIKDEARRLHVCLVDWEALDAISAAFGRDFKRADATLVEHLPEILESAGLGAALYDTES